MGSDANQILQAEFAEPVVLTYVSGSEEIQITTQGIFDETYEEVNENGMVVQSDYSRLSLYEDSIESGIGQKINEDEEDNWTALVRSVLYKIKTTERDGTGVILLTLRHAT